MDIDKVNNELFFNKECQINIQSALASTGVNTRFKKHKDTQTESKEDEDISEKSSSLNKINKILAKRGQLIEDALIENNQSNEELSSFVEKESLCLLNVFGYKKIKSETHNFC